MTTSIYCVSEVGSEKTGPCKIGISSRVYTRVCSLQAGNWRPIRLLWTRDATDRGQAKLIESHILGRLRPSIYTETNDIRLKSEWVSSDPDTILNIVDNLLAQLGEPV